jgi:hypothetical protein
MGQDGRRRFLTKGAVTVAASVIAGVATEAAEPVENTSRPGCVDRGCVSYHPNESLALAIVRAWSEESFRSRLLTFPGNPNSASWEGISSEARQEIIGRTRAALGEMDIFLDSPVVLTVSQLQGYKKKEEKEIIFVLPDPSMVNGKQYSIATAKVAMAIQCFGM